MVDVSNKHKSITVGVSSNNGNTIVTASSDTAQYWSNQSRAFANQAKDWANKLDNTVDGTEYSAKYYSELASSSVEGFEDVVANKTNEVVESGNTAITNIESARDNAIIDITNQENLSVDNVNTAGATQISGVNTAGITQVDNVNSAGTTQINLAKEQVTLATNQANIATEQATIATNKASEVVESGNEALSNIDTAKDNAITAITTQETTSKNNVIATGNEQVTRIEATGNNYDNLTYKNITNCLLEVPQRIKLELNDGTLTLKAGSEVIVPNGFEADGTTPKFDYMKVENDTTVITANGTGQYMILYNNGGFRNQSTITCYSGGTQPTISATYATWYDTTSNKVKLTSDKGATWTDSDWSLPFCLTTTNAGVLESVDQIFNGIGYMGSIVWVDKGVKGLIPNGRNEDGSLKNIEVTTKSVLTFNVGPGTNTLKLMLNESRIFGWWEKAVFVQEDTPDFPTTISNYSSGYWYKPSENKLYYHAKDSTSGWVVYSNLLPIIVGTIQRQNVENSSIVSFDTKPPFRAVDYSDLPITSICKTKATTSSTATQTSPAVVVQNYVNGTSWYRVWSDGWIEQGGSSSIGKGATTVTFLKSFRNDSYTFVCTPISVDGASTYVTIKHITAQNIVVYLAQSNYTKSSRWYACGY